MEQLKTRGSLMLETFSELDTMLSNFVNLEVCIWMWALQWIATDSKIRSWSSDRQLKSDTNFEMEQLEGEKNCAFWWTVRDAASVHFNLGMGNNNRQKIHSSTYFSRFQF